MKNLVLISILLLPLYSYKPGNVNLPDGGKVVVIFENMQPNEHINNLRVLSFTAFSYIGEYGLPVCMKRMECQDTMILPTIDGHLEVAIQYKGIQLDYYLLKGGDTVSFTYDTLGHPVAHSALSSELTYMYNFGQNIPGSRYSLGFLPENSYILSVINGKDPTEGFLPHLQYINNYRQAIDSAKLTGILDSTYLAYYEMQYEFTEEDYNIKTEIVTQEKWLDIDISDIITHDDRYTEYISYFFSRQAKANEDAFKAVINNDSMPPQTRKLILFSQLRALASSGLPIFKSYYDQYSDITGDTMAYSILEREFGPFKDMPKYENTGNTILIDENDNEKTLEDLLDEYRGKVIYIDFWASWCLPCIGEMPDALKLRREYAGKDVVFVYLAKGDNFRNWQDAIVKHKTADEGGINYYIVNSDTSDIIRDLKISLIPRYVIIDKTGKIADPNAPRPSGGEKIREVLNGLLQ